MQAYRQLFSRLTAGSTLLFALFLLCTSILAQVPLPSDAAAASKTEIPNERIEIRFSHPQLLELELTRYLTTDVRKSRIFEVTATLVEPLKTESGLVIVPALTKVRLKASVRPGDVFGHPGEIVMWMDPFLIGKGIEGFPCEPSADRSAVNLLPQLCQISWRLSFDHQLDHAATPEAGRPLILTPKKHHEGITGTRASRPPSAIYDSSGSDADMRIQTAVNRFQTAGIVYEIGAAFTGAVRFLLSKRNIFLPTGTRVIFLLEDKLRLVPATDSPIQIIQFDRQANNRPFDREKSGQDLKEK